MTSVEELNLSPGEVLYNEGDSNQFAFVIEFGEVILYSTPLGVRTDIERRGAGSIIGELSILTGQNRTVTVEALTACTIYRIPAQQILNRFETLDPVLRACIDTSINFTATLTEQLTQVTSKVSLAPSTLRNSAEIIEQLRLETDLVQGVSKGQFYMVYQPIVQMRDGSILGFEALMRWQHPVLGNIPPDRFIAVAEATGSIGLITDFALTQACAALSRLRTLKSAPIGLYASINISGQDIGRYGFVDFLAQTIDRFELDPKHISLEVTETAIIQDAEAAFDNFKTIRALGCGISIDDFGTGYSNLRYLKSLPLTTLKIDRAFSGDAHANCVSRGIVGMLVQLGKDLDLDIVAEGVETREDVKTLYDLGCRLAQGFHYSKPMRETEMTD